MKTERQIFLTEPCKTVFLYCRLYWENPWQLWVLCRGGLQKNISASGNYALVITHHRNDGQTDKVWLWKVQQIKLYQSCSGHFLLFFDNADPLTLTIALQPFCINFAPPCVILHFVLARKFLSIQRHHQDKTQGYPTPTPPKKNSQKKKNTTTSPNNNNKNL